MVCHCTHRCYCFMSYRQPLMARLFLDLVNELHQAQDLR